MHFQYNAILYALLIIVFEHLERGQYVLGAISYALLLSAKHIYLYVAPAFALYYVKKLLLDDFRPKTFLLSVLAGLATLLVVFLPFLSI
jgi:alpha-1,3-glucosyltransferase